jgi:hypothetical protein
VAFRTYGLFLRSPKDAARPPDGSDTVDRTAPGAVLSLNKGIIGA